MGRKIEHIGTVERVGDQLVVVRVAQTSECGGCAAAHLCKNGEEKGKRMEIHYPQPECFSAGDRVMVTVDDAMGRWAVFVAYVIPILLLLSGLSLLTRLWNDGRAALGALGLVCVYFCVLRLYRNRIARKLNFEIKKL